jgi:hypothetical protein
MRTRSWRAGFSPLSQLAVARPGCGARALVVDGVIEQRDEPAGGGGAARGIAALVELLDLGGPGWLLPVAVEAGEGGGHVFEEGTLPTGGGVPGEHQRCSKEQHGRHPSSGCARHRHIVVFSVEV